MIAIVAVVAVAITVALFFIGDVRDAVFRVNGAIALRLGRRRRRRALELAVPAVRVVLLPGRLTDPGRPPHP